MDTFTDYPADEILADFDEIDEEGEDFDWNPVDADAYVLESAGWGTDEDYGFYGGEDW